MATKNIKKILLNKDGDNYVADIEDIENRITQNSSNLETAKQELSSKCDTALSDAKTYTDTKKNEALNEAKAYTDQEKAKLFNSTNGTFTGEEYFRNSDEGVLRFNGGNTHDGGASLQLYAKNPHHNVYQQGVFDLVACTKEDASDAKQLIGMPDGRLTWNSKNIVRSVNGALADDNGNVEVISHTIQNTNNFASTFLYNNMGLKIQCIRISGNQGQQYGTINWLLPFADTNYHVFVTSEDPDENTYFQIADVTLVGKTTTSCKVGHKVENIDQFYTGGFISVVGIGY